MKPSVSRTFLLIGLPASLVLVALIFGGMEFWGFLQTSPRFAIREVEVTSEGKLDKDAIVRLAGIPAGKNIFSVDLDAVRKRVEKDPWVYSATVVRVLPNKIQIQYRSQVPVAILGAGSMYYLNREGVPFYRIQKGDSLEFPLVQVDGKWKDRENLRQQVEVALQILEQFRLSPVFSEKDLGDMTVRLGAEDGSAPYVVTLRYPPKNLVKKTGKTSRLYSVTFSNEDPEQPVKRWAAVVRHLVQQGKNPRLIRLELGKKVVVKVER
jgi:cell division protein FtsQ